MFPMFCCIPPPGDFVELDVGVSVQEYDLSVFVEEFDLDIIVEDTIELSIKEEPLTLELVD